MSSKVSLESCVTSVVLPVVLEGYHSHKLCDYYCDNHMGQLTHCVCVCVCVCVCACVRACVSLCVCVCV